MCVRVRVWLKVRCVGVLNQAVAMGPNPSLPPPQLHAEGAHPGVPAVSVCAGPGPRRRHAGRRRPHGAAEAGHGHRGRRGAALPAHLRPAGSAGQLQRRAAGGVPGSAQVERPVVLVSCLVTGI